MFTKKYCCSSDPGKIARVLAIIDIVFSILMIFLISSFINIFLNYPKTLKTMVDERPSKQEDLRKFLAWGTGKKVFMLSIPLAGSILNGLKGVLLLVAANTRSATAMKIWMIATFVFLTTSLLTFVAEVIFTQDKVLMVIISIFDWIYEAFSIWIGKCYFCELLAQKRSEALGRMLSFEAPTTNSPISTIVVLQENQSVSTPPTVEENDKF